jgi:hypothetical protein
MALLIITYGLRAFTDAVYVSREVDSVWTAAKYVTLFLACAYGTAFMLQTGRQWKCLYLFKYIGLAAATLVAISLFRMLYHGVFSAESLKVAFHMLLPVVVCILSMSILESEDIYRFMSWILVIAFAIYCVFEIGLELFTAVEFGTISFDDSYSPFESHYTSGTAIALCAYFSYYRKRKPLTILGLIFALLVFKRLFVLFGIAIFLLPMFFDLQKKVSKSIPFWAAVFFCLLTIGYYWCMIPENLEAAAKALRIESLDDFTSGRSSFFGAVYSSPFFVNFGLGAIEAHLGRLIEMDLIQLLVETSIVGLAVFSFCYWKIAGRTWFAMIYMAFNFMNMLTSHSFQNGFIWSIVLLTLLQAEEETLRGVQIKKRKRLKIRLA